MDSEIVYIALGQAGIQTSHAAWELFCLEHGIDMNGRLASQDTLDDEKRKVFFNEDQRGNYTPRALIVDLEPTVVDEIRAGAYRDLHNGDTLLSGYEDAANNYARGHFTKGRPMAERCMEVLRREISRCEKLQGFLISNGLGGGTGSGFATLLLQMINEDYRKHNKVMINVFPGPSLSTAVVEPYNVALTTKDCVEFVDVNITLDNEAIYKICTDRLLIDRPSYNDVNRLMAQVASAVTCSLRFSSSLNSDLNQMQTNLVPYPRIHFPVVSYAPIISRKKDIKDRITIRRAVKDLFEPCGRLVSCDTTLGKFIACNVQFRGVVSPSEMNAAITQVKANRMIEFVDWCPTGFKIGICSRPPLCVPSSMLSPADMNCTMLANNTCIGMVWDRMKSKFNVLYSKRAFLHWYVGEGMEEGEMNEAQSELTEIIRDYKEIGYETQPEEKGQEPGEQGPGDQEPGGQQSAYSEPGDEEPRGQQAAYSQPGDQELQGDEMPIDHGEQESQPYDEQPASPIEWEQQGDNEEEGAYAAPSEPEEEAVERPDSTTSDHEEEE